MRERHGVVILKTNYTGRGHVDAPRSFNFCSMWCSSWSGVIWKFIVMKKGLSRVCFSTKQQPSKDSCELIFPFSQIDFYFSSKKKNLFSLQYASYSSIKLYWIDKLFFKLSIMLKYLLIRVHLAIVLVRLLLSSYGLSMQIIEYFRCVKLKLMKLKDDVFQLMTPTCCSNALLTSSFLLGHMIFCSPRDSVSGLWRSLCRIW